MENLTVLEKLDKKIDELLKKVYNLKEENETLRQELAQEKSQCQIKNQEIQRLEELNMKKDREIEEIVTKIESLIG